MGLQQNETADAYQAFESLDIRADEIDAANSEKNTAFPKLVTYSPDQYSATANMFSRPCTCRAVLS